MGIVALPLALAFGVSSGVGAEAGLITAIIAGLIAAIFGGSNVQVSGPTGAMVVVLAPIIAMHGVGAVATLSVMAGLIVLAAGILKLGRTVGYIPWPVIEGFTAGIGVIIFLQQVPSAVGVNAEGLNTNALIAGFEALGLATWPGALLPLAAVASVVAVMLILGRFAPNLPGSFIAIAITTFWVVAAEAPIPAIGELPSALPAPAFPEFTIGYLTSLTGPAFAVAALAAIESLLSARVAAAMAPVGRLNADRELVGQGLASIGSGIFGGMPATGAIARTAVNLRSGAKSRLASVVHALALLGVVYLASTVVSWIPLAALAGVLMVTAARMVSPKTIQRVFRSSRSSGFIFIVTALVTITFDLVIAVLIGVVVAAFFALRTLSKVSDVNREPLPGTKQPGDKHIAIFRVAGSLFFGAADRVTDRIREEKDTRVVILVLSQVQLLDATGANTLTDLIASLERDGVTVLIKGMKPEHQPLLERLGTLGKLRHPNHIFRDLEHAVEHARTHV